MKKYYGLFIIPLLGIVSINNGIKTNLDKSNLKSENATIIDIETNNKTSGATVDTDLDGYADTLYMWGDNSFNGLIDTEENNIYKPTKIDFAWNGNLIDFELGYYFYGLTVDTNLDGYADTLYMWGDNQYGQIGNGARDDIVLSPTIITPQNESNWNGNITNLELGNNHSAVTIDADLDGYADSIYDWGLNVFGQIGNQTTDNALYPFLVEPENNNWRGNITHLSLGKTATAISIDNNYKKENDLYVWGVGAQGMYGRLTLTSPTLIYPNYPRGYEKWGDIKEINIGQNYNLSVIADSDFDNYADSIYLWGDNNFGMLGDGSYDSEVITYATDNKFMSNNNIIDVNIGESHTGVTIDNDLDGIADVLYMAGRNNYGQIGNENQNDQNQMQPNPVIITPKDQENWNGNILKISIKGNQSMLLLDQNNNGLGDTLYMWGNNSNGQLGIEKEYNSLNIPTEIITTYQ